jgi:hypothetical protein
MKSLFIQYGYLQILDLLTTLAFLNGGVDEGNPLIATLMQTAISPLTVLIAVKVCALLLGMYCWRVQRRTALARATTFYAVLIAWNLLCLIVSLSTTPSARLGGHA